MITNATIHFNETGTPVADKFDDVYFSNHNGLAESDYVFYQQNHINQRLETHDQPHFVIAETGFGTGLNFLNAWHRFSQHKQKKVKRLHFISFEKYPMTKSDLATALGAWQTLARYSQQLISQYPQALQGCHRLEFENGAVVLDLWFGDVLDSLNAMHYSAHGLIDAWFLDGFAPSKNPDMWQQPLFNAMANCARNNATFATFTAAGFVRRGLQEAGFTVNKVKGFGRKREMLAGVLPSANAAQSAPCVWQRQTRSLKKVALIGGGIASASVIASLAKRGIDCELFCQDPQLAQGGSHNLAGAVYPHLQADYSISSEFFAHSFLYAKRLYQQVLTQGFDFDHQWCGVLLQGVKEEIIKRQQNLTHKANWPDWLINAVSADKASELAAIDTPYGGLFIPQGGWVNPPQLVQALIKWAQQFSHVTIHLNHRVTQLSQLSQPSQLSHAEKGWQLQTNQGEFAGFSDVIMCAAEHTNSLLSGEGIALQGVRGQVSHLVASEQSQQLRTVLCHKGYFTPAYQGVHCMGATFEKDTLQRDIRHSDNLTNWQQFSGFYGECDFVQQLGEINGAKAAIRAALPDRLPLAGQYALPADYHQAYPHIPVGDYQPTTPLTHQQAGLHLLTGLGARGLCSAPLSAELLVASLLNEPLPISERVNCALHPARFIIRQLKQRAKRVSS